MISVADIDTLLAQRVNKHHYARVSIRAYASSLRSFFRYAEMRGWCGGGIAASIMAPRVFQQETLPSAPSWDVVKEILDATSGDQPTVIRDHAILLVLAVYGVRSSELARLRLDDIDWQEGNNYVHPCQGRRASLVSPTRLRGISYRPICQEVRLRNPAAGKSF